MHLDGHWPSGEAEEDFLNESCDVGSASEAQTPSSTTLSVGVDDPALGLTLRALAELSLDTDVLLTEGTETLSEGIFGVDLGVFQGWEESLATSAHALDDGGLEAEVESVCVRLGDTCEDNIDEIQVTWPKEKLTYHR